MAPVDNGQYIQYSRPRTLTFLPGYDLENFTTLRSLDDATFIAKEAADKDVVLVGTSFIGIGYKFS